MRDCRWCGRGDCAWQGAAVLPAERLLNRPEVPNNTTKRAQCLKRKFGKARTRRCGTGSHNKARIARRDRETSSFCLPMARLPCSLRCRRWECQRGCCRFGCDEKRQRKRRGIGRVWMSPVMDNEGEQLFFYCIRHRIRVQFASARGLQKQIK